MFFRTSWPVFFSFQSRLLGSGCQALLKICSCENVSKIPYWFFLRLFFPSMNKYFKEANPAPKKFWFILLHIQRDNLLPSQNLSGPLASHQSRRNEGFCWRLRRLCWTGCGQSYRSSKQVDGPSILRMLLRRR